MLLQDAHRTTFAGSISDEDDLVRRYQSSGHLFIEGRFFGYAIALIVSLLAMNQMVMVVVGIVGRDGHRILRTPLTEIAKNMCRMVIDNDDHPTRLNELVRGRFRSGQFKKFPKSRHLLHADFRRVRSLEDLASRTHHKGEF